MLANRFWKWKFVSSLSYNIPLAKLLPALTIRPIPQVVAAKWSVAITPGRKA
jgi:hypothetical protein